MLDMLLAYWHILLTYHPMNWISFQLYQERNWLLKILIIFLKIKLLILVLGFEYIVEFVCPGAYDFKHVAKERTKQRSDGVTCLAIHEMLGRRGSLLMISKEA